MKKILSLMLVLAAVLSLTVGATAQAGMSYNTCYAYTACPGGGMIQCQVWGSATTWTACTWNVIPYQSVRCEGYNGFGMWEVINVSCPGASYPYPY